MAKKKQVGNVLVIGNSGVGKSTLINAVLGQDVAKVGWGVSGTTKELEIYESSDGTVPFRIIDTIGFEQSLVKQRRAINAVKHWSKDCAKKGNEDHSINAIWFCVPGTAGKLFPETIRCMSRATSMWKTVPVIVVITKSYSAPEREQNKEMVYKAFALQNRYKPNLKEVLPVVAQAFFLDEDVCAPPFGISKLIEATNNCMPEGIKAGKNDLDKFILNRKRALAHSVVAASTAAGVSVAVAPLPFADAALLGPIERVQVEALAKVYDIGKSEDAKKFIDKIVDIGTVGAAAKGIVGGVKEVIKKAPGVNVVNAAVAGSIIAALGEASIYAYEQIYLGNQTLKDLDWLEKVIDGNMAKKAGGVVKEIAEKAKDVDDVKDMLNALMNEIAENRSLVEMGH